MGLDRLSTQIQTLIADLILDIDTKTIETNLDSFQLIQDPADFAQLCGHFQGFSILGVDFEGEWNLHRYGLHLCLIQVSDGQDIFLIDPLTVGDLDPFLKVLENPEIKIISHGPQSDIVLLDHLFGRRPTNVFDTEKAGQLLGYESTSLSGMLDRHFGLQKNMKVRVSDWNKRPLKDKMLQYAAMDVAYLHTLRDRLVDELNDKGRLKWHEEECLALEDIRYRKKEQPHLDIQRANRLNRRQAHVLKYLYELRDSLARDLDKPAYYIIPNAKLIELAAQPPSNIKGWTELKGVNPRVKRHAKIFYNAVHEAMNSEPEPTIPTHRMNRAGMSKTAFFRLVDQRTQVLEAIRDQIKEAYDIYPMILSMKNLKRVAYGEATLDDFKAWQKEIVVETAQELKLDLGVLNA